MVDIDMRLESERCRNVSLEDESQIGEKLYKSLKSKDDSARYTTKTSVVEKDEGFLIDGMSDDYDTIDSTEFCNRGKKKW